MRRSRPLAAALALGTCAAVLGACAGPISGLSIPTTAPNGARDRIPATLTAPDGPGPFPAVVIMHDCSGLGPGSSGAPGRWSRELVGRGYVTILPDSFTTRGHPGGVCTVAAASGPRVSPARRVQDAYAALAYLRTLPNVDGRRVGIMGGSHGGTTTLATMVAPEGERGGFAAAVALYPGCGMRLGSARADLTGVYRPWAPLLILIGDKDDWTPAEHCRTLADAARAAGQPVSITIYPGAYHSFDSYNPVRYVEARINANAPGGRGATTGGNAEAWADSIRQVTAFFGRHLAKGERP
jgi:dienelactone hydrolase